jgi:CubicO group peptidase (beta-lactamase class C family)
MKHGVRLAAVAALVLTGCDGGLRAQELELARDDDLHEVLLARFRANAFAGAVLVTEAGDTLFRREYGVADHSGMRPIVRSTRFDVGSVTKLFTAVAALRLAQDGSLDLDARLEQYLPGLDADVPGAGGASVRQLLQHRAGFGDYLAHPRFRDDPQSIRDLADFMALVRTQPLAFAPGTDRQYSNSGFIVLGAVLEAVTGSAWHETVREVVLEPAVMQATSPARDASSAVGYTRQRGRVSATEGRWPSIASPAGGMNATAGDVHRFVAALMADELLSPAWTDVLLRDFEGPLEEAVDRDGGWDIAWEGGAAGLNAHASFDAPRRRIVVVLSNIDPPAAASVGRAILRQGR